MRPRPLFSEVASSVLVYIKGFYKISLLDTLLKPPLFRGLLILTLCLFIAGISLPVMTLSKLVWISNTFSIGSGIADLWGSGHYFLGLLILFFSIVLPLIKWALLFIISGSSADRYPHWLELLHNYGRWGMLDVLVVALLVVAVKLGAIASVTLHSGIYFFAASVLLMMGLTQLARRYEQPSRSTKT